MVLSAAAQLCSGSTGAGTLGLLPRALGWLGGGAGTLVSYSLYTYDCKPVECGICYIVIFFVNVIYRLL